MRRVFAVGILVFLATILFGGVAFAKLDVPAAPPLDRPIVDQTKTLSDDDIARISDLINAERQKKSFQIGVLIIPTLGSDDSLEEYSLKVARQWGVGEKNRSNGVLMLIAKNDRKIRIEVGDGMEGNLTDAQASRIIRNVIAPKFRAGDYVGGVEAGVTKIIDVAEGKEVAESSADDIDYEDIFTVIFAALVFGVPFLGSILARSKSWWAGGVIGGAIGLVVMIIFSFVWWAIVIFAALVGSGLLFDFLVSRNYREAKRLGRDPAWWAGGSGRIGGGSHGSGGSSGGFGGGGFSGGGASGGW